MKRDEYIRSPGSREASRYRIMAPCAGMTCDLVPASSSTMLREWQFPKYSQTSRARTEDSARAPVFMIHSYKTITYQPTRRHEERNRLAVFEDEPTRSIINTRGLKVTTILTLSSTRCLMVVLEPGSLVECLFELSTLRRDLRPLFALACQTGPGRSTVPCKAEYDEY